MTRNRLLAILWTLGILAACSLPGKDLPDINVAFFDKIVHYDALANALGLLTAVLVYRLVKRAA